MEMNCLLCYDRGTCTLHGQDGQSESQLVICTFQPAAVSVSTRHFIGFIRQGSPEAAKEGDSLVGLGGGQRAGMPAGTRALNLSRRQPCEVVAPFIFLNTQLTRCTPVQQPYAHVIPATISLQ